MNIGREFLARVGPVATLAGQVVLTSLIAYVFLGGPKTDFSAPLQFHTDSLFYSAVSKGTLDHGWWWVNPSLGAPSEFKAVDFGQNANVDQALLKTVGRFANDIGRAQNFTWILMLGIGAATGTVCFRFLGLSRANSFMMGALFGLCPYALNRNLGHFSMAPYLVPFPATLAVVVTSSRYETLNWRQMSMLVLGCAVLGANYIYFSFFGCYLLGAAAVLAYIGWRDTKRLAWAGAGLIALVVVTTLNMLPTLAAWQEERPILIRQKQPRQADIYAFKMRSLVMPIYPHAFGPFNEMNHKESAARYPHENFEKRSSRLGLVGTVGFLILLGALLKPRGGVGTNWGTILALSRFNLLAFLLGTAGGIGSLVSLLATPDIRAYARITSYISFFAVAAAGFAVEEAQSVTRRRSHSMGKVIGLVFGALVLLVGLADQTQILRRMRIGHAAIVEEFHELQLLVKELENQLPTGAMVFQLPATIFLNDPGHGLMGSYDQFKPYLAAGKRLRWSYPAFSNEQFRWDRSLALAPLDLMLGRLYLEGFLALLLDKNGFADGGKSMRREVLAVLGESALLVENERYSAFSLRGLAHRELLVEASRVGPATSPVTPNMVKCRLRTAMNLDSINGRYKPFGPGPVEVRARSELILTGWATLLAERTCPETIEIVIADQSFLAFNAFERPDIAELLNEPKFTLCGFRARVPPDSLPQGHQVVRIRAPSRKRACYHEGGEQEIFVR